MAPIPRARRHEQLPYTTAPAHGSVAAHVLETGCAGRRRRLTEAPDPGSVSRRQQTSTLDPGKTAALAAEAQPMTAADVLGPVDRAEAALGARRRPFLDIAYLDPAGGSLRPRAIGRARPTSPRGPTDDGVRLPGSFPGGRCRRTNASVEGFPGHARSGSSSTGRSARPERAVASRSHPAAPARTRASWTTCRSSCTTASLAARAARRAVLGARCCAAPTATAETFVFDPAAFPMGAAAFAAKYAGHPASSTPGKLLNQPHKLTTVSEGDEVRFVAAEGLEKGLLVTAQYLEECAVWAIQPCNKCGLVDTLDPPSVMARTRFPDAPADAQVRRVHVVLREVRQGRHADVVVAGRRGTGPREVVHGDRLRPRGIPRVGHAVDLPGRADAALARRRELAARRRSRKLARLGFDGAVFVPEPRDGAWTPDYDGQITWEEAGLHRADCILFWVPRDMETLPGLHTNVEFRGLGGLGQGRARRARGRGPRGLHRPLRAEVSRPSRRGSRRRRGGGGAPRGRRRSCAPAAGVRGADPRLAAPDLPRVVRGAAAGGSPARGRARVLWSYFAGPERRCLLRLGASGPRSSSRGRIGGRARW